MFPISSVEDPPLEGAAPPAPPAAPAAAAASAGPAGPAAPAAAAPAASAGPTATTNVATTAAAAAVPPPPAGPSAAALAAVGPPHTWPRPARSAVGVSPQNNLQRCTKCKHWKEGWRFIHVVLRTNTKQCDLCRQEARALALWDRVHNQS